MGFFSNFKAKRAAKRAHANYQVELFEWEREPSPCPGPRDLQRCIIWQ